MDIIITKKIIPIRILFCGWTQLVHSYGIVLAFQLIHLYKNYGPNGTIKKNAIEIHIEEAPYYNPKWTFKKLVYTEEYNFILENLIKFDGDYSKIDLIYRQTFPYNINVIEENKNIPKCIFYTSEFSHLNSTYFQINYPPNITSEDDKNKYISLFLKQFNNIFFTSPSEWSSKGLLKYINDNNRNKIITHGVDTTIFYKKSDNTTRIDIRKMYSIKETDILLINIGGMHSNKGILLILEALNNLVNKQHKIQYKLLLKGTKDLYTSREFIEMYFQDFKNKNVFTQNEIDNLLQNHIIFIDKTLSFERINDLFNASDLYISPYLCEGFGLTMLDALSSGLPVLVPETGSTVQYINNIYNNGGTNYINFVKSHIVSDSNSMCQNIINVDDLIKTILNFKKIDNKHYSKMVSYIEKELSWNKVSELLIDYFTFITTFQT